MPPGVSPAARCPPPPKQRTAGTARYQSTRALDVPKQRVAVTYYEAKYARRPRRWSDGVPTNARGSLSGVSDTVPTAPAQADELNPLSSIYEFHPFGS